MSSWLCVFLGGGLGSLVRFAITRFTQNSFGAYPWGTLGANLLGALLAGFAAVMIYERRIIQPPLSDFLLAGFLGGLTTFSSMILDAHRLSSAGSHTAAVLYIFLNLLLGFALFSVARHIA